MNHSKWTALHLNFLCQVNLDGLEDCEVYICDPTAQVSRLHSHIVSLHQHDCIVYHTYVCTYVSKSPSGNPATVPDQDQDQVQDREREKEKEKEKEEQEEKEGEKEKEKETEKATAGILLDAPGVLQTSLLGVPGLHFETLGVILATRAPKGDQSRPKGPQMKKASLQESSTGRLWAPLGNHFGIILSTFSSFLCKSWGLDSGHVFLTIFFRKATSVQRLHVAKP